MRNLYLSIFLFLLGSTASAQQYHFMYLESENKQPFYVIMDSKVYSSSLSGYLILSKLLNTNYKLTVGFPKNAGPKLTFNYVVKNKDGGFGIRDFGDKGWGLFNLQTAETIMAGNVVNFTPPPPRETSADPFSNMLANVVHDSSINKKESIKEEPTNEVKGNPSVAIDSLRVKEEPVVIAKPEVVLNTEVKKDTTLSIKADTAVAIAEKPEIKPESKLIAQPEEKARKIEDNQNAGLSTVVRKSKRKNKEGLQLIYIDRSNDQSDTISVVVPYEKPLKKKAIVDTAAKSLPVVKSEVPEVNTQPIKEATMVVSDSTASAPSVVVKNEKIIPDTVIVAQVAVTEPKIEIRQDTVAKPAATTEVEDKPKQPKFLDLKDSGHTKMVNSDCKAQASEDDFLKLRKKMAGESGNDEMIRVAKKTFKAKCFTTEQVKNLGVLFLKDEGKYAFFETAYSFVSDTDIFSSLENQFTDTYYINRFKAMIHH